jgi:hypothetical protein
MWIFFPELLLRVQQLLNTNSTDIGFIHYLNASKRIFPEQWAFLLSHQNVNQERNGPELTVFKERQIFVTLLLL